ncbi:MAG: hypothetical protein E7335_06525 [Clostridiales bacterium]|nr:hypothetical protein [Clostridiales bacterium]
MIYCPCCGKMISSGAERCPYCGETEKLVLIREGKLVTGKMTKVLTAATQLGLLKELKIFQTTAQSTVGRGKTIYHAVIGDQHRDFFGPFMMWKIEVEIYWYETPR